MGDKVKYRSGLVDPGQREAQFRLRNLAAQGDPSLSRDAKEFRTNVALLNPVSEEAGSFLSGIISSKDPLGLGDVLTRYRDIATGTSDPIPEDGLFGDMVRNIELAGTRARENAMAAGSKYGNQFSSASRAAGIAAEGEANIAGKAKVAEMLALRQVQRAQMRLESANLLATAAKYAIDSKITATQLQTAADQWAKGVAYQEWARNNPAVAQLLEVIYGKNIDTIAEKKKSWIGPALVGVAGLVATIATGGAAGPMAFAAWANSMSGQSTTASGPSWGSGGADGK